ncbi:hypothetical protein ACIPVK_09650 [Paeniglutamicibacter sp. MACA_103]|uniref:hypothetical protein n=1 Tax=Paeniglutamicibacter sp. MACA_103 TaxID=3377337 RepID=UPI0038949B5A
MLRVRPVVNTAHAAAWAELLLALGLAELRHDTAGERCFAAASGRVVIRPAQAFAIDLGFEVRDLEKFAQWTRSDGTEVLLRRAEAGPIGHITADDGLEFTATPVDANVTAGSGPAPAGSLGVLAVWNTPDVTGSAQTLRNIGAVQSPGGPGAPGAHFRAKHGGYVEVRAAGTAGVDLEFGIHGDAGELAARLAAAGLDSRFAAGAHGRTLLVPHPDGGDLRITERHHPADGRAPRE